MAATKMQNMLLFRPTARTCPDNKVGEHIQPVQVFVKKQLASVAGEKAQIQADMQRAEADPEPSVLTAANKKWIPPFNGQQRISLHGQSVTKTTVRHGAARQTSASMNEFGQCIVASGLIHLPFTGCPYTWHNCSEGTRSLWKRLDRMLVNAHGDNRGTHHMLFRFDNFLTKRAGFIDSVKRIWNHKITGTAMNYSLHTKKISTPACEMLPFGYSRAVKLEEIMLHQRAKLQWLKHGGTRAQREITLDFLRPAVKYCLSQEESNKLCDPVTYSEIRDAMFDIAEDSAPSPDGYSSAFFKASWSVVGHEVSAAICEFFRADIDSIQVIKDTLSEFAALSGLKVNPHKSQIILSKAVQQDKQQMIDVLGFQEGFLPVRYLGVPLISSRLKIADCKPLIDKLDSRIAGWSHLNLSFAGRAQLIQSVLSTLHSYWASVFILHKGIIKILEAKLRKFLWQGATDEVKPKWHGIRYVDRKKREAWVSVASLL
ncbi:UNVERIFIED_CONTAM: hypothetical protein Scaly_1427000 [Sesamum calycinum]|uniref:Uncharacterized protein n=1 Tax=Sesamum calycinum TaxID=2727403 RepID=A0AAW2PQX0_9LAMI